MACRKNVSRYIRLPRPYQSQHRVWTKWVFAELVWYHDEAMGSRNGMRMVFGVLWVSETLTAVFVPWIPVMGKNLAKKYNSYYDVDKNLCMEYRSSMSDVDAIS